MSVSIDVLFGHWFSPQMCLLSLSLPCKRVTTIQIMTILILLNMYAGDTVILGLLGDNVNYTDFFLHIWNWSFWSLVKSKWDACSNHSAMFVFLMQRSYQSKFHTRDNRVLTYLLSYFLVWHSNKLYITLFVDHTVPWTMMWLYSSRSLLLHWPRILQFQRTFFFVIFQWDTIYRESEYSIYSIPWAVCLISTPRRYFSGG